MNVINLGTTAVYDDGQTSVVIRHYEDGIKGGKVLDLTGYTEEAVKAGHLIIKKTEDGVYKPMPVSNGAYASLPSGHEYAGVSVTSILVASPEPVGIMTSGEVNDLASPYEITSAIKTAFKTAVPTIRFDHD